MDNKRKSIEEQEKSIHEIIEDAVKKADENEIYIKNIKAEKSKDKFRIIAIAVLIFLFSLSLIYNLVELTRMYRITSIEAPDMGRDIDYFLFTAYLMIEDYKTVNNKYPDNMDVIGIEDKNLAYEFLNDSTFSVSYSYGEVSRKYISSDIRTLTRILKGKP